MHTHRHTQQTHIHLSNGANKLRRCDTHTYPHTHTHNNNKTTNKYNRRRARLIYRLTYMHIQVRKHTQPHTAKEQKIKIQIRGYVPPNAFVEMFLTLVCLICLGCFSASRSRSVEANYIVSNDENAAITSILHRRLSTHNMYIYMQENNIHACNAHTRENSHIYQLTLAQHPAKILYHTS